MEFVLHYSGTLKSGQSSGIKKHKHDLRCHFHHQIRKLTERDPIAQWNIPADGLDGMEHREGKYFFKRKDIFFSPLVNSKLQCFAEISISMLRPEGPGNLIHQTADIDNRLKTLFDSLQVPVENQMPDNETPSSEHDPFFFCLLEDDRLITKVSVQAQRLLDPERQDKNEVDLQILVKTGSYDSTRRSDYLR